MLEVITSVAFVTVLVTGALLINGWADRRDQKADDMFGTDRAGRDI